MDAPPTRQHTELQINLIEQKKNDRRPKIDFSTL